MAPRGTYVKLIAYKKFILLSCREESVLHRVKHNWKIEGQAVNNFHVSYQSILRRASILSEARFIER